jgi:hypothetical protein
LTLGPAGFGAGSARETPILRRGGLRPRRDRLYYIVAFVFVAGPIGWLAAKERSGAETVEEARGISGGSTMYSAFALFAFVVFSIWPALMRPPYHWLLRFLLPGGA